MSTKGKTKKHKKNIEKTWKTVKKNKTMGIFT